MTFFNCFFLMIIQAASIFCLVGFVYSNSLDSARAINGNTNYYFFFLYWQVKVAFLNWLQGTDDDVDLIVGGTLAAAGEFPFTVKGKSNCFHHLLYQGITNAFSQALLRRSGSFFCGGTLISPSVIMTAAHCLIR